VILNVIVRVPRVSGSTMDTMVTGLHEAVACSIECARHHGFEPYRLPMPADDIDGPCVFCGTETLLGGGLTIREV
jgi:hypothetical protein